MSVSPALLIISFTQSLFFLPVHKFIAQLSIGTVAHGLGMSALTWTLDHSNYEVQKASECFVLVKLLFFFITLVECANFITLVKLLFFSLVGLEDASGTWNAKLNVRSSEVSIGVCDATIKANRYSSSILKVHRPRPSSSIPSCLGQ